MDLKRVDCFWCVTLFHCFYRLMNSIADFQVYEDTNT
jgi:hypothetical protein